MMTGVREFLNSPPGRVVASILVIGILVGSFFAVRANLGQSEAALISRSPITFIDATTGKTFTLAPYDGMTLPVKAPSGGNTGYMAERCYWTADGKPKTDPTFVLLESAKNPASKDPTFCPDCGRLVVARNPAPGEESTSPPPTKEQWLASRKQR